MTAGMGRPKKKWPDGPPRMERRERKRGGFNYYYQAAGRKIPLGSDLDAAKIEWARLEQQGPMLLLPAIAKVYRDKTFEFFSDSTRDHYETALRNLEMSFRSFTLDQIIPRHVKDYLRKRSKKGAAMFEKRVLSALFNWAREEGYTSAPNPCHGVKFSRTERQSFPSGKRKRYVTEAEFAETYARADFIVQDCMDLALLTGQRPSDILAAKRSDMVDGVLWVIQAKTGAKVGISIEGELQRVLERILARPRAAQSLYLVSDAKGQRVRYNRLNTGFVAARAGADWQFRDIRAKNASDSETLKEAQERLGHASEVTTARHYRRNRGTVVSPLKRR